MRRVFTSPDRALVGFIASIVEGSGYECFIKNEFSAGGVGDIPAQECWPELWVLQDADEMRVRELVDSVSPSSRVRGAPWRCERCGEWLEPAFSSCWACAEKG